MSAQPVETTWKNLSKICQFKRPSCTTFSLIQDSSALSPLPEDSPKFFNPTSTLAWLELMTMVRELETGDDWLPLCDDIDQGELYRDWFLWYDAEVTQQWEAYDPLTDDRLVAGNKETVLAQIDKIETARHEMVFSIG